MIFYDARIAMIRSARTTEREKRQETILGEFSRRFAVMQIFVSSMSHFGDDFISAFKHLQWLDLRERERKRESLESMNNTLDLMNER